jgi:hypothetical protein
MESGFFFNPYNKVVDQSVKDVDWVQDEVSEVEVQLSNPCSVPLEIQWLQLCVEGEGEGEGGGGGGGGGSGGSSSMPCSVECYPASCSVPPKSNQETIRLSAKPLQAGRVEVTGAMIRTLNLQCVHCFEFRQERAKQLKEAL